MDLPVFDIAKEFEHAGMIDWLTLKLDLCHLPEPVVRYLQSTTSKIFKVNAHTGDIDWETYSWESVRSDTHQLCYRVGTHFSIQGSPARIGLPNNVFGALDIGYCATKMIQAARQHLMLLGEGLRPAGQPQVGGLVVNFPPIQHWTCSRIDVTRNYVAQSESEARQALAYLKQSPEGRQKHSYESHGFYIGKGSTLHKGKVYLKGQDALRNQRQRRAQYTEDELLKTGKLLRAEYTIGRHLIKRIREQIYLNWYDLTPDFLLKMHDDYFREYFSEIEVTDMSNVLERLIRVSPTEGQARSAYDCYLRIRSIGYEQARQSYTKPSWYRHVKHLKNAGFKRSDLVVSNTIPLRKRAISVCEPVRHWDDIKVA